jgi:hypothetical protein
MSGDAAPAHLTSVLGALPPSLMQSPKLAMAWTVSLADASTRAFRRDGQHAA